MKKRKRKRMLHQHPSLRSLWEILSSQGLQHQSPKLLPKQQLKLRSLLNPREAPGTFLLKKRTRPQCLKLKKKMQKPKC